MRAAVVIVIMTTKPKNSQVTDVTDELGTSYDVTNLASTLNYDVKKTDGEIKGVFTDQVGHAKVYVEEYDGEISTVTVKFVDETNNHGN